jgi:TM2 domain-containing membrane protein YozV
MAVPRQVPAAAQPVVYAQKKSPLVALVLSLLIVGLGQFYNGEVKKGATMLIAAVVTGILTLSISWWVIAIWSAVDAYRVAAGLAPRQS